MKKGLLCRSLLMLAAIALITCSRAQLPFAFKADLEKVHQAGFYKIILDPAVVAKCKDDISDIRIMDNHDTQVPYILTGDQPLFRESHFTELPIISIRKEKDKQTHVVIRNKPGKPISELLLIIRNTAANRTVTVSGSDDNIQWFVIQENITLDHFFNPDKDSYMQSLGFPTSSYDFFKIIINGEDLLPVNIVRAGVYEELVYKGSFSQLPAPAVTQVDSADKSSYISLLFNDNYRINKIELDVKGPKFYQRLVSIQQGQNEPVEASTHTIRSDAPAEFIIDAKTNRLNLKIWNEDNLPLRLKLVKALQSNHYLLTYLEPATSYHLVFGNERAGAPSYDLAFFKSSIGNPAVLQAGPVKKRYQGNTGKPQRAAIQNTALLWIVIITVLTLLLLLTFRMARHINAKESPEKS
ncbi:MAG: hypothetical protein WKF97_10350 [Chitinophagaceae bacterium]